LTATVTFWLSVFLKLETSVILPKKTGLKMGQKMGQKTRLKNREKNGTENGTKNGTENSTENRTENRTQLMFRNFNSFRVVFNKI
jgi:hypothetical protein